MSGSSAPTIGLLLRSPPYASREPRAELDLALAALALDYAVEVYFTGDSLMQLARHKASAAAGLPAGYRAWAALPELGELRLYAESAWLRRCERAGIELMLPVEGLGHARMKQRWRRCDLVLVL
jgi:sulfur relay (sulfurtransferase) DsrF/TusC family protein